MKIPAAIVGLLNAYNQTDTVSLMGSPQECDHTKWDFKEIWFEGVNKIKLIQDIASRKLA